MMQAMRRLLKFFAGPDERDCLVKRIGFQVVNDTEAVILESLKNMLSRFYKGLDPVVEDKRAVVRSLRVLISMGSSNFLEGTECGWRMVVRFPKHPLVEVKVGLDSSVKMMFADDTQTIELGFV